jgi:hypothetical protein
MPTEQESLVAPLTQTCVFTIKGQATLDQSTPRVTINHDLTPTLAIRRAGRGHDHNTKPTTVRSVTNPRNTPTRGQSHRRLPTDGRITGNLSNCPNHGTDATSPSGNLDCRWKCR